MHPHSPRRALALLAFPAVLGATALTGCGPAGITIGIVDASKGGAAAPTAPSAAAQATVAQPRDDWTRVAFVLGQRDGRTVRYRLLHARGGAGVLDFRPVPAADVARDGAPFPFDDGDAWREAVTADGQLVILDWHHAATLAEPGGPAGRREWRSVSLRLEFADADGGATQTLDLFTDATLGRQVGTTRNVGLLARQPEEPLHLRGEYADFGGDRDVTTFRVELSLDGIAWQAAPGAVRLTETGVDAVGAVLYELAYDLDPFALQPGGGPLLPRRAYPGFALRVQPAEAFGPASRFPLPTAGVASLGAPHELRAPITVGRAPLLGAPDLPNPLNNASDPGRPWFRIPVGFTLTNTSDHPAELRLRGEYRIPGENWLPMTLADTGRPETRDRLLLGPGQAEPRTLLWNAVVDVGLGHTLEPPFTTANCRVLAEIVDLDASGQPVTVGAPVTGQSPSSNSVGLNTNPFTTYREDLLPDAFSVASAGVDGGGRTRDLFFSRFDYTGRRERFLHVDQSFEPVQIPGLQPTTLTMGGGILQILPTDYGPGPDCIVDMAGPFVHVQWPEAGNAPATVTPIAAGGFGRGQRGGKAQPISFLVGPNPATLFFRNDDDVPCLPPAPCPVGPRNSTIHFNVLIRDLQVPLGTPGDFVVPTAQLAYTHNVVGSGLGDFGVERIELDGDPATVEVVVGQRGMEGGGPPGNDRRWLHLYRLRPQGGTDLTIQESPLPLPPEPLPIRGLPAVVDQVWLERWQEVVGGVATDGIVLVRALRTTGAVEVFDSHVLLPRNGDFLGQTWRALPTLERSLVVTPGHSYKLKDVLVADLDGPLGGDPTTDLVFLFRTDASPSYRPNVLSPWLLANRNGVPGAWRPLFRDAAPTLPNTWRFNTAFLVDVNGDQLLDLVVKEEVVEVGGVQPDPYGRFVYFPSSLTGAAGSLGEMAGSAGQRPCALPAVLDVDGDGFLDLVSGGLLHRGQPNGAYVQDIGGFSGGSSSYFHAEQVLDPQRSAAERGELDVLIWDPANPLRNSLDVIANPGTPLRAVSQRLPLLFGPRAVRWARPILTGPALGPSRDVVAVADDGGLPKPWLLRFRGRDFVADPAPLLARRVLPQAALVRRGPLPAGRSDQDNRLPQDLVVAPDDGGAGHYVVFRHDQALAATVVTLPELRAGERVVSLCAASVSQHPDEVDPTGASAALEDLLLCTKENDTVRVWAVPQSATGGVHAPRPAALLLQFVSPLTTVRGLQFDPGAPALAQGVLLLDQSQGGGSVGEARFLLPGHDGRGRLGARMIRSTLPTAIGDALALVVTDSDRDGLVEVVGGSSQPRVLKIDRSIRR